MSDNGTMIVAVVFGNYDANTGIKWQEKPYFYLDLLHLTTGDVGLVHNGHELGLVRVARVINPREHPDITLRVSKPILAKVVYDHDLMKSASGKLAQFQEATIGARIEKAIDRALGIKPSTEPVEPPPPRFPVSERITSTVLKDDPDDNEIPF